MKTVAGEYALALFGLAKEKGQEVELLELLQSAKESFDDDVMRFFLNPKVTKVQKKDVIDKVIENSLLKHLFYVLIDHQRMNVLEQLVTSYQTYLSSSQKLMVVEVVSGKILDSKTLLNIKANLEKEHSRVVTIQNRVDHSILAGIRIEYDGFVVDRTVNRYLADMTQSLKQ